MRVLVAGSAGQVGSCLVKQLAQTEWQVLSLDRSGLDISNLDEVKEIVHGFKPDVIINAAAYTAVDNAESEVELAYAINRDGAKYLAQAAESNGAVFLHVSTDYVFSGEKSGLYNEADLANPVSVYGKSKLAGELAVAEVCERHIILRTAWIFGETGSNFLKTMLHLGQSRSEVGVVVDQYGGPTYAYDVAKILVLMISCIASSRELVWGVYHYSGYPYVSWYEFAEVIFERLVEQGLISEPPILSAISTNEYPTAARRPKNSKLDCNKIKSVLGVEPSDWITALDDLETYFDRAQ